MTEDFCENPPYLCYCLGKTPEQIEAEIRRLGLRTPVEVYDRLLRGGACHICAPEIEKLISRIWGIADAERQRRKA